MPRRGDTARIRAAQRAGIFSRLITDERLPDHDAEALLASWELHAELTGHEPDESGYWSDGERWIWEQLARR